MQLNRQTGNQIDRQVYQLTCFPLQQYKWQKVFSLFPSSCWFVSGQQLWPEVKDFSRLPVFFASHTKKKDMIESDEEHIKTSKPIWAVKSLFDHVPLSGWGQPAVHQPRELFSTLWTGASQNISQLQPRGQHKHMHLPLLKLNKAV